MASRFKTFLEDQICAINEAVVQKIPRKRRTLACPLFTSPSGDIVVSRQVWFVGVRGHFHTLGI